MHTGMAEVCYGMDYAGPPNRSFPGSLLVLQNSQEHARIISCSPHFLPLEAYVQLQSLEYSIFFRETVFSSVEYGCW